MLVPRAKMERKKFCSKTCLGVVNAERLNRIRRPPREYFVPPPVMYGRDNPMWRAPLDLACKQCLAPFSKPHWRISTGHTGEFCSFECKTAYWKQHRTGKDSPDWVGGPTTYRGQGWPAIRAQVIAEQQGRCKRCDVFVGGRMPVHHIKPFREFQSPALANERTNLVGLCQPCHMWVERQPAPHEIEASPQ